MKELQIKQAEAKARAEEFDSLPLRLKLRHILGKPGRCEKQLRRLYVSSLMENYPDLRKKDLDNADFSIVMIWAVATEQRGD